MTTMHDDCLLGWDERLILRGTRIERSEGRRIGELLLDASTLRRLNSDSAGVIATQCEGPAVLVPMLKQLAADDRGDAAAMLAVATCGKQDAAEIYHSWASSPQASCVTDPGLHAEAPSGGWVSGRLLLGTIETVCRRIARGEVQRPVAALLIVDPMNYVCTSTGFVRGQFTVDHDRTEVVERARSYLESRGWRPPVVVLTHKEPRAISPAHVRAGFRLNALWLVDGRSLRCGRTKPTDA